MAVPDKTRQVYPKGLIKQDSENQRNQGILEMPFQSVTGKSWSQAQSRGVLYVHWQIHSSLAPFCWQQIPEGLFSVGFFMIKGRRRWICLSSATLQPQPKRERNTRQVLHCRSHFWGKKSVWGNVEVISLTSSLFPSFWNKFFSFTGVNLNLLFRNW